MMNKIPALIVSILLFSTSLISTADEYVLDPVHTQIIFFADHLGFSKSQGKFVSFDGHFSFDPDEPGSASTEIVINTASIEMNDADWNAHMKNEDFFNVEKYPTMTFKSTKIDVLSKHHAKVHGELTMIGHTEPVTLDVVHNKSANHPFSGKYTAGFSATTSIKRSLFGMNYGLPALGDDIEVRIEVEGQKKE